MSSMSEKRDQHCLEKMNAPNIIEIMTYRNPRRTQLRHVDSFIHYRVKQFIHNVQIIQHYSPYELSS